MPPYYRRRFYTYPRRRKANYFRYKRFRFRPRRWRPRNPIRRRRRKTRVRKRYNFYKRKLKALPLKQWQPELINKCSIKGLFTLFACNEGRGSNNYPQYRDSFVPLFQPGGGGWGIFVFNLGAFFDEFLRVRNYWTVTNVDKPLCRYLYCKLRLYRAENCDYVVYYTTSYPMTDNEFRHADACPSRMLMRKHKIIVQSRQHTHKRPYITKKIRPPKQLINKWFFQRDFVNTNLLMLTATACSLTNYDIGPKDISNNITLTSLNYTKFRSLNFQRQHTTEPYQPTNGTYFYHVDSSKIQWNNPTEMLAGITYGDLTFLGQATRRIEGIPFSSSKTNTWSNYIKPDNSAEWGNVFYESVLHDEVTLLQSNIQPSGLTNALTANKDQKITPTQFTIVTESIFIRCRYNPDKDTGKNTKIYLVPNFQNYNDWTEPQNDQLKFHGFPLWMLLWGWADWQKKLALVNQIDQHYIIIIESEAFEPKLTKYMFLDDEFITNTLEFPDPDPSATNQKPLLHDEQNWYPKFWYQQKSIDKICMSGPATHKFKNKDSIQAHMEYIFRFKWGGTSSTMETIADPSKQPKYPTTDNILSTVQIQNPATDPRDFIYPFDFRRHCLTQKAATRLTKQTDDEPISLFTDPWNPIPYYPQEKDLIQAFIETQSKKEEKAQNIQQFIVLRNQQQLLQQRINRLIIQSTK